MKIKNGRVVTTSLDVAAIFGKEHKHVLRDIRALACSPEFHGSNFGLSSYTTTQGKDLPVYEVTRDGFTFLAMGFTGATAARFKEAYICAFDRLDALAIAVAYWVEQMGQDVDKKVQQRALEDLQVELDVFMGLGRGRVEDLLDFPMVVGADGRPYQTPNKSKKSGWF